MTAPEKPGWQTTEFYVTGFAKVVFLAGMIATALIATGTFGPESREYTWLMLTATVASALVDGLASLGYSIGRSMVKTQEIKANADVSSAAIKQRTAEIQSQAAETRLALFRAESAGRPDPPVRQV